MNRAPRLCPRRRIIAFLKTRILIWGNFMNITIPELSLVVLVGASGSGKSSFARQHFLPTEVLSSDFCRGLVSDDENDQAATKDAFDVLHFIAAKRLAAGKLVVVDATNVQPEARKPLVALAREYHCLPVAIVLDMPERVCLGPQRLDRPGSELRAARHPQPHQEPAAVPARPGAGRVSVCLCPAQPGGGRRGNRDTGAAVQQQERPSTGRSTLSATCMGALTN